MNILTPEDYKRIWLACESIEDEKFWPEFARAIETAILAKLTVGFVAPEHFATLHHDDGYFTTKVRDSLDRTKMRTEVFTLDQLNTAIAAARVQAIKDCEDAIETANARRVLYVPDCIDAIRALLGKGAT